MEEANGGLKKGDWVSAKRRREERREGGSPVARVLATRVIFRCV
jgi:hypothetical protein